MADMEILIFIAETHGDNFLSMLPSPCVYMSILQQIVAHLTFIARKYHLSISCLSRHITFGGKPLLFLLTDLYLGPSLGESDGMYYHR